MNYKFSLFLTVYLLYAGYSLGCVRRSYGLDSFVCVCNMVHCDEIPPPLKFYENQLVLYTSSQVSHRFSNFIHSFRPASRKGRADVTVNIDPSEKYQEILGWGGAFTDSTGININSLSYPARDFLLRSYFSEYGIQYNLCRVPIGGTDFSTYGYSYDDGSEDSELKRFELAPEDYEYKIPLIHAAKNLSNHLLLLASAWTAPIWMKHNGRYMGPDFLRRDMYQPWANYFIKFLREYKKEDLDFWAISSGNEPINGLLPSPINSVGWFPFQLANFVGENLGPTLRNSEFNNLSLLAFEGQRLFYPAYVSTMFHDNRKAAEYSNGFAVHGYFGGYDGLTWTHKMYPDKFLLATEYSQKSGVRLGDWNRAEDYASDIIKDLQNWVIGWIDWNMALDVNGGPTYVKNFCDSPIIVNATSSEFYKQPMYYALGHFTKFIPRRSRRIKLKQSSNMLEMVAFQKPNMEKVLVLLNKKSRNVTIKLMPTPEMEFVSSLPAKSITTILFK